MEKKKWISPEVRNVDLDKTEGGGSTLPSETSYAHS